LTLAVISVIAFALAEVATRQVLGTGAFVQVDQVDFGQFYLRAPETTIEEVNEEGESIAYRTDRLGLRSRGAAIPSALRMLVLGDSFVEAANTPDDQTFTAKLERDLARRIDHPIEVYNGGLWGYSNARSVFLLDHVAPELRPSLVLLMVYLGNDLRDNFKVSSDALAEMARIVDESTPGAGSADPPGFAQRLRELAARSYLLTWIYRSANRWGNYYVFEVESFRNQPAPEVEEAIDRTREILGYLARLCDNRGFECVVAGIPSKAQVYREFILAEKSDVSRGSAELAIEVIRDPNGYSFDNPTRAYQRVCDAVGLPYFDLLPVFRRERNQELYYKVDRHWKASAQALAAQVLAEWIADAHAPRGWPATPSLSPVIPSPGE
jgi:hypothetical protein